MTDTSNTTNLSEIKDIESLAFTASSSDSGKRLDAFLAEKIENWSRSRLQKLIDDGDVLVNEKTSKSSHKLRPNDEVEVELTEALVEIFEPEDIPLNIVFEDEYLAVINKPAGLVVHPGAGIPNGTLANAIAFHFKFQASEDSKHANRVGIVHRLDKDTSGLIVVAKNEEIHEALSGQFRNREVFKSYVALTHGEFDEMNGKIDAPIAREKHNRVKMSVRKHGRNALSLWKVKKSFEKFTLVEIEIKTGRTHQIRVHLSYINHPVVGDELYNSGRDKTVRDITIRTGIKELDRFFLHAEKLSFSHPITNERLNFVAPLPDELNTLLDLL